MNQPPEGQISIALSGGGTRAMLFHLGVLRYLAERGLLERIQRISTVSGGSLLVGLILEEASMRWPSSDQFVSIIYPALRKKICERSLLWEAIWQILLPWNWRFLLSRANLLALALEKNWGVTSKLCDLPLTPEISINGTPAENGKRFRFKRDTLGDYAIGYAATEDFPLANALAMSAAVPGVFGPLVLNTNAFQWRRRPYFGAPEGSEIPVNPEYEQIHLYDGGVYDNLGLEPFFDVSEDAPKSDNKTIIVSDAGAPLQGGFSMSIFNPMRFKRVADIISDQARSLRVRNFIRYLKKTPGGGAYLYLGTPTTATFLEKCELAQHAVKYSTTLTRPSPADFDAIAQHGYNVASKVDVEFGLYGSKSVSR